MSTILKKILSSKFFSPSLVILFVGGLAGGLAYDQFRTAIALGLLFLIQVGVGIWRRSTGRWSWKLSALRLSSVLLLAPIIYLDSYGAVWARRIRFTLKGELPQQITGLQTYEDIWTDYVITMRFKAEPSSVRRILESSKFERLEPVERPDTYVFVPVDRPADIVHQITVSRNFTEVFIEFATD